MAGKPRSIRSTRSTQTKQTAQTDLSVVLEKLAAMSPKQLVLVLLVLLVGWFTAQWQGTDQTAGQAARTGDILQAAVTRVVDGDTIVVEVDGQPRRVRLLGVDTPETVHPRKEVQYYGPEASAFTKRGLTNQNVWLEYDAAPLDRYQRHLAYIWLEPPSGDEAAIRRGMFNARLLTEGYAKVLTIQPNSRYADLFVTFQEEAQAAGRGLWGKKQ